jgi:uncharacterized caspase-like protein
LDVSVTTDTDALLKTVREAHLADRSTAGKPRPDNCEVCAALDALASELETMRTASAVAENYAARVTQRAEAAEAELERVKVYETEQELVAALERVKAERDELLRQKPQDYRRFSMAEARLDEALAAVEALWATRIVTGETAVVNTRELTDLHKLFRAPIAEIEEEDSE